MMEELRAFEETIEGASPIVRPYALTGGRTHGRSSDLPLEAQVVAAEGAVERATGLPREQRAILELCRNPLSIVEVAAFTRVPLGVTRVLVSDLAGDGMLIVGGGHAISSTGFTVEEAEARAVESNGPVSIEATPNDISLLERVLHGLRDI